MARACNCVVLLLVCAQRETLGVSQLYSLKLNVTGSSTLPKTFNKSCGQWRIYLLDCNCVQPLRKQLPFELYFFLWSSLEGGCTVWYFSVILLECSRPFVQRTGVHAHTVCRAITQENLCTILQSPILFFRGMPAVLHNNNTGYQRGSGLHG